MAKKSVGEAMLGKSAETIEETDNCLTAKCFCLMGDDDTCIATAHVVDGSPCICFKDANGTTRHLKLADLAKLLDSTT